MVRSGVQKKSFDEVEVLRPQDVRKNSASAMRLKLHNEATAMGIELGKKTSDQVLACRYELKYRISESETAAIEQFIKLYIQLDRYSKLRPDGYYPILSLYLDSKDLRLCRETLEGKKNRFKLRVRSYSGLPEAPCFFEIKRRINNIILKSRAKVKREDVVGLLRGRPFSSHKYETDLKALKQFQLYMSYISANPVLRLRYMRKAYENESASRVRITFDRKLHYNITGETNLMFKGREWRRTAMNFIVLEIKFTERYPAWLNRMVKHFDLKQRRLSKV